MRDSTFGDPAGLNDDDVVQGRPEDERVRPRDRDPQRAHRARRSRSGRDTQTTSSPTRPGCTTRCTTTTSSCPDNGYGYAGANGFKTGYTEIARAHARRDRERATAASCIAVILGVVDSGYTWAASLLDQVFGEAGGRDGTGESAARRSRCRRTRTRADGAGRLRRSSPGGGTSAAPLATATTTTAPTTPRPRRHRRRPRSTDSTATRRGRGADHRTTTRPRIDGGGLFTTARLRARAARRRARRSRSCCAAAR